MVQPHTLGSTLAQDGHMVIHSSLHKSPFGKKKKKKSNNHQVREELFCSFREEGTSLVAEASSFWPLTVGGGQDSSGRRDSGQDTASGLLLR